ncbi:hypothetical protein R3P38DRAFT_2668285, partial [Favolaschia claudopus]
MSLKYRTEGKRTASEGAQGNKRTLSDEVAAVGAAFDTSVGDANQLEASVSSKSHHKSSEHHASESTLAGKWGLPVDEVAASTGAKLTRSTRSNLPKRLELSGTSGVVHDSAARINQRLELSGSAGTANDSAAKRLELSGTSGAANDSAASILAASGELQPGSLPGVDQNALTTHSSPRIRRSELEEYLEDFHNRIGDESSLSELSESESEAEEIFAPAVVQTKEWTVVGNKADFAAEGGKKAKEYVPLNNMNTDNKFFPTWFDLDFESTREFETAPFIPEFPVLDTKLFGNIFEELSDNEDVIGLFVNDSPSDDSDSELSENELNAAVQAALLDHYKNSKVTDLGMGRRAGSSKVKLGATTFAKTEYKAPSDKPKATFVQGSSKGKGVDQGEKGPDYERLRKLAKKGLNTGNKAGKKAHKNVQENHLK